MSNSVQNKKVFDFGIIMYGIVRFIREIDYLYVRNVLKLKCLHYKAFFLYKIDINRT